MYYSAAALVAMGKRVCCSAARELVDQTTVGPPERGSLTWLDKQKVLWGLKHFPSPAAYLQGQLEVELLLPGEAHAFGHTLPVGWRWMAGLPSQQLPAGCLKEPLARCIGAVQQGQVEQLACGRSGGAETQEQAPTTLL